MEKFAIYVPRLIPSENYFTPGHRACVGCGEVLSLRYVTKALGRDVIIAMATGCMEIISSQMPQTSWRVPWIHTLFENTAAVASGVEAALKVMMRKGTIPQKNITVAAMGGDGGTADIGIQALSGALERGHNFVYICFDNEAYMNTGIQRSSATPYGAFTTTSPPGKFSIGQVSWKKNMPAIVAAHNVPYVATACPGYPLDLIEKVKKAAKVKGPAYVHVLATCPVGWRLPADLSVRITRLAVETGIFPLYEIENGKYKLNFDFPQLRPVEDYLKLQGRFRHLTPETIAEIQKRVNQEYLALKEKAKQD